jgi:hypothetical protein
MWSRMIPKESIDDHNKTSTNRQPPFDPFAMTPNSIFASLSEKASLVRSHLQFSSSSKRPSRTSTRIPRNEEVAIDTDEEEEKENMLSTLNFDFSLTH